MKSRIRLGLLTAVCVLGAFTSVAHADDRDTFRQRVYDRARDNADGNRHRDHDRRDSRRDYSRDRDRSHYDRNHYDHRRDDRRDFRRDHDRHRHYDHRRNFNDRYDYKRSYYDRGHDHRRHFSYYDRFDRRFHPALKRGFFCNDFAHFRGRHYHVSRADFYDSFYPRYPYRPFKDGGGRATVIVSIPF